MLRICCGEIDAGLSSPSGGIKSNQGPEGRFEMSGYCEESIRIPSVSKTLAMTWSAFYPAIVLAALYLAGLMAIARRSPARHSVAAQFIQTGGTLVTLSWAFLATKIVIAYFNWLGACPSNGAANLVCVVLASLSWVVLCAAARRAIGREQARFEFVELAALAVVMLDLTFFLFFIIALTI